MNSSNRTVKRAMRSRRSSKPKFTLGRLSASDVVSESCGGRSALTESVGSNRVVAMMGDFDDWSFLKSLEAGW